MADLKKINLKDGRETASELVDRNYENIQILDDNINAVNEGQGNIPDLDKIKEDVANNKSSIESLTTTKQDKLKAGANITITSDNTISATGEISAKVSELQKKDKGFIDWTKSSDNGWITDNGGLDKSKIIYSDILDENINNDSVKNIMNMVSDNSYQIQSIDMRLVSPGFNPDDLVPSGTDEFLTSLDSKQFIGKWDEDHINITAKSSTDLGDITTLKTTDKTTAVNAINDLVEQSNNLVDNKADKSELSDYAKKTDIPDVSKLATKDELSTKADKFDTSDMVITFSDGSTSTYKVIK